MVSTRQALDSAVERQPAGTTFWLRPGTHHVHDGEYSQVLPKPGMRFVGAPGAVLDGRGQNLYAFGGRATGVVVEHLTIQHFGGRLDNHNEGVVNHDAAADWVVRHNTIRLNGGAGVMVGDGNTLARNCLASNGQYGFSAYDPDGVSGIGSSATRSPPTTPPIGSRGSRAAVAAAEARSGQRGERGSRATGSMRTTESACGPTPTTPRSWSRTT